MTRLMTMDEAADILRVDRVTVWRLIKSQKLRAFQEGRVIRTREDWVEAYIEAKSAPVDMTLKPRRNPKYSR